MNKLTRTRSTVKYRDASEWPSWTDEVAFYPTDADHAANAARNESHDSDGPAADDPVWEEWAGEAIAQDQLERGLRMF